MWTRSRGVVARSAHRTHVSVLAAWDTAARIDLGAARRGPVTRKTREQLRRVDEHGHNALHVAVAEEDVGFVAWALEHAPDLLEDTDMWGLKPLHLGAYLPGAVITALLNRPDAEGLLGCADACGATVAHHAAMANNTAVLRAMAKAEGAARQALATPARNDKAWAPIIYATLAEATEACMELASVPGLAAAVTAEGNTFVHVACSAGNAAVVERMLSFEYLAYWTRRNHAGHNPAMLACLGGHARIVMQIAGCNLRAVRDTLLEQDPRGWNGALMAAHHDHADVLGALHCQGAPFDRTLVNFVSAAHGRTRAAHVAAQGGAVGVLRLLFGLGGEFRRSLHDNDKRTLLLAVRGGQTAVLEFFERHFAGSLGRPLTASGLTAAHLAARDGQIDVLRWICGRTGARELLARPDLMGYMPAHWAAEYDSPDALRVVGEFDRALVGDSGAVTPMHVAVAAGSGGAVEWLAGFLRPDEVRAAQARGAQRALRPYEIAMINAVTSAHVASERIFRRLWSSPWSVDNTFEALLTIPIPGAFIARLEELEEEALDALPAAVRASLVVRSEHVHVSGGLTILADRRDPLASLSQLDEARESGADPCLLEVRFAGEPAGGDGLRREWLATVTRELAERSGVLERRGAVYHVARGAGGEECECTLRRLGQLIAASVAHGEPLGVPLAAALIKTALGYDRERDDARELDPEGYRTQVEWVADCPPAEWAAAGLELTFADEQDGRALEPEGRCRAVTTTSDRTRYAYKLALHRAYGYAGDMLAAVANGGRVLGSALPVLRGLVDAPEVVQLVRGATSVTVRDLLAHAVVQPPLNPRAGPMKWVLDWLGDGGGGGGGGDEEEEAARCAWLLRFATGCAAPPAGGLRYLMGYRGRPQALTFCEGPARAGGPGLPAAATCLNRLFVPMHRSERAMRAALDAARACGAEASAFDEGAVDTAAWGEAPRPA